MPGEGDLAKCLLLQYNFKKTLKCLIGMLVCQISRQPCSMNIIQNRHKYEYIRIIPQRTAIARRLV